MEVYSRQNVNNEYLTLKGIELRTGIKGEELYTAITGEVMDNSADDMENHGVDNPQVHVTVTVIPPPRPSPALSNYQILEISVRNSVNPQRGHVFSKQLLKSVYTFGSYYGSKRFYKINRGALGDASKLMLGAPYALADSMNIHLTDMGVYYPITHRTSSNNTLKTFQVGLSPSTHALEIIENEEKSQEDYTELQLLLPFQGRHNPNPFYWFLIDYILPNTHIGFTFSLPPVFNKKYFSATQAMINAGKNLSNPHFYNLSEFRQLIKELQDTEQIFYDMATKTFRGAANNLPRNSLTDMTIGELQQSANKTHKVFKMMRDKIQAVSTEGGLKQMMPFDTNKIIRKESLQRRLAQIGISCDRVKYKQRYGYFDSGGNNDERVRYPFFFETFVGHSDQIKDNLKVIQSVNSKVVANNPLVLGGPYEYNFTEKANGKKSFRKAVSIFDILGHYKYSFDQDKCKKPNSLIALNLASPRIGYESHGKSRINHLSFAEVIAEVVEKAAKGGDDKDGKIDQIVGLRQVLARRKADYLAIQDPLEKTRRVGTQSDIFYATRKLLIEIYGYTDKEISRKHITESIREECAKLGVSREDIGIIAAERAQLYFDGKWYNVGLDDIEEQINYGTDMVIIEKEGIVIQVSPFSNAKRIALLNTRGFLVEYASKLAKLAKEKGCNIAILVDWDVSGLLIYLKVKKIIPSLKRIGVDFQTLEKLGLLLQDVEEKYNANENNHFDAVKRELKEATEEILHRLDTKKPLPPEKDEYLKQLAYLANHLDYLEEKRIEINSITAQLNDNAKFWSFIEDEIRDAFKDRLFTRSAKIPEYVIPTPLQDLNDIVEKDGKAALKPRREELQEKLDHNNISGFLFDRTNQVKPDYNMNDYDAAIEGQSRRIIENDSKVKSALEKIGPVVKQLKEEQEKKQ